VINAIFPTYYIKIAQNSISDFDAWFEKQKLLSLNPQQRYTGPWITFMNQPTLYNLHSFPVYICCC